MKIWSGIFSKRKIFKGDAKIKNFRLTMILLVAIMMLASIVHAQNIEEIFYIGVKSNK